ncbi:hypothetical protein QTL95_19180 [Rhizobium sp. S152]|uniref:DUF7674 family protein n=1 Tax=Rhizobium sp. S152 TaxID=3055038 RepID=UPI0025A970FE|nr:hypothetical protein [Rhizobium sp. S152]MDM9628019.1 hypothetical protein [Rhizobium sp. S152]
MNTDTITSELAQSIPGNLSQDLEATTDGTGANTDIHTLYSDMGWLIAERFASLEDRERVFELIEMGMRNGDSALKSAVSTGLIEAMISRTGQQPARWKQISAQLGPLAMAYVHS